MQLSRAMILAVSVSTVVLANSGLALADIHGGIDCSDVDYAGCDLGAGRNDQPAAPSRPQRPGTGGNDRGNGSGEGPHQDNPVHCQYVRSDYQPPSRGTMTVAYHPRKSGGVRMVSAGYRRSPVQFGGQSPQPEQSGAWYVYQCTGNGWHDAVYRWPFWMADTPQQQVPSPQQLAQQAYNQLRLPSPQIHASPAATQLVNLPTWLWMDRGQWHSQGSTASVPGVSVTATATPQSVTWSMGNGSAITCRGAGTPFLTGRDPKAASPDCGFTYRQTSQGRPNNTYPVKATVHWTVTWSGAGQSGAFPDLTTTSNAAFAVAESQALNQMPR